MAVSNIMNRNSDKVKPPVRTRAAGDGRSMEGEARVILRDAAGRKPRSRNLASAIRAQPA